MQITTVITRTCTLSDGSHIQLKPRHEALIRDLARAQLKASNAKPKHIAHKGLEQFPYNPITIPLVKFFRLEYELSLKDAKDLVETIHNDEIASSTS